MADETKETGSQESAGFLQEDNGSNSMMRLMSIVCLIVAILVAGVLILRPPTGDAGFNGLYIFTIFMVAAFAPKAVQKFAEEKMPAK